MVVWAIFNVMTNITRLMIKIMVKFLCYRDKVIRWQKERRIMKLEVKELKKTFGEKEVLHGISFEVESGQALGLLGRNGAGKTTTIRILMDVFKCNSGEIIIDGKPFKASEYSIGYLPEERGLYPKKKIKDQMLYLARLRGLSKDQALKNIDKWLTRLEVMEYKEKKLETLSKGNQQKVQLASTLVADPEIVILDEPFSGLDPVNSQILKDVVNELIEEGKIVIFSSHQMSYVEEFCDNIAIINHGDVVLKGRLKDIKKEFGQNRLVLSVEDMSNEALANDVREKISDLVSVDAVKKEFVILVMNDGVTKEAVLEKLLALGVKIEHFGIYEPSLNDIFVAKAGDE